MIIQRVKLLNWHNMEFAEFLLEKRMFFLSPGGSGQSECLDVFRFLHDLVSIGGGMQSAISVRGGLAKLRGHYDPSIPQIGITLDMQDEKTLASWTYHLAFTQESRGYRRPVITREEVWKNSQPLLIRPDPADREDNERLTQTALEQACANREFRDLAFYFDSIAYLHPISGNLIPVSAFPDVVALTAPIIRKNRLERISAILGFLDPDIGNLHYQLDQPGQKTLNGSGGTLFIKDTAYPLTDVSKASLQLIVLLWWMLDNEFLLLLEEPENYLDVPALSRLPSMMHRLQLTRKTGRQILIGTHSPDLLADPALDVNEIVTLLPSPEGPAVLTGIGISDIQHMLATGIGMTDDMTDDSMPMFKPS